MHFFIDHTQLTEQTSSEQRYGPDATTPETKFNLTTQFQLTNEAKAFACQDGMMIVQKNNSYSSSLVNVIIKPSNPIRINGITVRYYIYRGIKLSGFLSGSEGNYSITPKNASTNTEFIASFWSYREKLEAKTSIPAPTPYNIGYGDNNLPLSDPNNLNELRPVRDLFNGKAPAKAFHVKEGMWIGDFTTSTKIAFEIQLESELRLTSTLNTCRTSSIHFETDNLTGLALKRRKELIGTYIDPVAFFGMHCDIGVYTTTYTGTVKNTPVLRKISTNTNFYSHIVSKFSNRNRVYLDIRSERGLSYNFYDTYKVSSSNPANIRLNSATVANATEYVTNGWPILYFDTIINHNTNNNQLSFRLHTGENTNPVLYLEDKKYSNVSSQSQKNFYKNSDIKETNPSNWTKNITLYYPNARNASHSNIATLLKLFYFVGEPITASNNRLRNNKYYDSAFCSIDLENLGDISINNGHVENSSTLYIKESLQNNGTGNFAYAAATGAYWDSNRILFYCKSFIKTPTDGSGKRYLRAYVRKLSISNTKFNNNLRNDFYYVCKKYQDGTQDLKILGLNNYRTDNNYQEKEDLMLLGLTTSQLQTLKNTSGLSPDHPRYIFLELDHNNHLTDTNHYRYYRYSVKIQGLNANGTPTIITPSSTIIVYSRDNNFFCSSDFASQEAYNFGRDYAGDNRLEYRIYRDGAILLNDNIDLSLVRKRIADDLTLVGNAPNYVLADDNTIPGDTSTVQQIHYIFYDIDSTTNINSQTPYTDFCSLYVIMENMRKQNSLTTQESSAVTEQNFSSIGYTLEFDYTPFNFLDVWAQKSYKNTNGVIITRGKLKNNPLTYGNKKYTKSDKKIFMVYVDRDLINQSTLINNRLEWFQTVRCFARPDLLAVFLGTLRDVVLTVQCGGFAYPDASSFPSNLHVNGFAFDTNYFRDIPGNPNNNDNDLAFIRAIHKYGTGKFRIGPSKLSLRTQVINDGINAVDGGKLHNGHLHTEDIILNTP